MAPTTASDLGQVKPIAALVVEFTSTLVTTNPLTGERRNAVIAGLLRRGWTLVAPPAIDVWPPYEEARSQHMTYLVPDRVAILLPDGEKLHIGRGPATSPATPGTFGRRSAAPWASAWYTSPSASA